MYNKILVNLLYIGCVLNIKNNLLDFARTSEDIDDIVLGIDNFSSSTMSNLYPLLKKPNFITTVIYDSPPEAMMNIHQHNQRGITLVVDEILALFNSVKRYNSKNPKRSL